MASTGYTEFPKLNFGGNLFNGESGAIWTAEISDAIWDDVTTIKDISKEFHRDRYILLKHLPSDTTEEDVRKLLNEFSIQLVYLQPPTGRVRLTDPTVLEHWDDKKEWRLKGTVIGACPSPTEGLLCVAHLPPNMNDEQFKNLVNKFGEVRSSFIMKSDKTGESKGYGFVEYTAKEVAFQAKTLLGGRRMGEWSLSCDWVDASLVTVSSLHSRCLRVDGLPKDYRDMMSFRKLCSTVTMPPYCQIVLRNGSSPDFGLVEFETGLEAELTMEKLSEATVWGQRLRVSYWIPGVRAINIYMGILNGDKGHTALMPSPPSETVFKQLQNLTKHNPQFAQNLQNIILSQIQDLQQPPPLNSTHRKTTTTNGKGMDPGAQESLTANAKAALALLLATQIQSQGAVPSNPQISALIQNVLKLGGGKTGMDLPTPTVTPPWPSPPGKPPQQPPPPIFKNGYLPPRGVDIPTSNGWVPTNSVAPPNPGANMLNSLLENAGVVRCPPYRGAPPPVAPHLLRPPPVPQHPPPPLSVKKEDLQDTIHKLVNNIQNLKQLLGNLNRSGVIQNQEKSVHLNEQGNGLQNQTNDVLNMLVQALGTTSPQAPPSPPNSVLNPMSFNVPPQYPNSRVNEPLHLQQFNLSSLPTQLSRHDNFVAGWMKSNGFSTPTGQKRKHTHILPSPEPSPENGYVGQHSQGIGGHYADSYSKRKKRD